MFVLETIIHRLKRGCETMAYPDGPAPALPDRHGGALEVDASRCADGCHGCVPVCPTQALTRPAGTVGSAGPPVSSPERGWRRRRRATRRRLGVS